MSGYIGTQPVPQATQTRQAFTATASQTSFATAGFTPQFVDVYLNGIKLAAEDYVAENGSDIVLTTGAALDDTLEVVAYTAFEVGNAATAAQGSLADAAVQPNDSPTFGSVTATSFIGDGSSLTGMSSAADKLTLEPAATVTSNNISSTNVTVTGTPFSFTSNFNVGQDKIRTAMFAATNLSSLVTAVGEVHDFVLNGNVHTATITSYFAASYLTEIVFSTVPDFTGTSLTSFEVLIPANTFTTSTPLTAGVEYFTNARTLFTGDGTSSYNVANATTLTDVYERYTPLIEGSPVSYLDNFNGDLTPDFGYLDNTTALTTRYKEDNPSFYYTAGDRSVDLSFSDSAPVVHSSGQVLSTDRKGASAPHSFAAGYNPVSSGYYSVSMGYENVAYGTGSTALGYDTLSTQLSTLSAGYGTMAAMQWSTCLGRNGSTGNATYTLLGVAYSANPFNRSPSAVLDVNLVFKVNHQGNGYFDGSADVANADYAEYFESFDGTPLERGYFVSFVEGSDCVSYGNDNIVGIVSAAPAVVGDSQSLHYRGKYKKDEFETYIREPVTVTEELINISVRENGTHWVLEAGPLPEDAETFLVEIIDTLTQEVLETITDETDLRRLPAYPHPVEVSASYTHTLIDKVLSPEFDEEQHYVPRSDRPEWSPIGILGKLWVHVAAGEVVAVGDYITSDTGGKAVKCLRSDANSYRVTSVNTEYNLVKVFYK